MPAPTRPVTAPPPSASLWRSAAGAGLASALLGAAIAVGVALICWLPDASASGQPGSVLRSGVLAFLAAHHGGLELDGVHVAFLPLGLLLAVAGLCWRSGSVVGSSVQLEQPAASDAGGDADADGDAGGEDRPGADPARLAVALAVQVAGYLAVCTGLILYAHIGTTHVSLVPTLLAAAVTCTVVSGISAARYAALPLGPLWLGAGLRAGAGAVAVLLLSGAVLSAGAVVVHASRVMQLSREVGGGLSGAPVALLGALSAPNAAISGVAYLAGPGFTVGTGAHFSLFGNSHAVLPAFPLLGALPNGPAASVLVLALAVTGLLAVGAVSARLVLRAGLGASESLLGCVAAALVSGAVIAALTALAGGSVGSGRLRTVGGAPLLVGGAVTGEVAGSSLLLVGLVLAVRSLRSAGSEHISWSHLREGAHLDRRPWPGRDDRDDAVAGGVAEHATVSLVKTRPAKVEQPAVDTDESTQDRRVS